MTSFNHTIEEYRNMSNDVWQIFKKYFPADANNDTFPDDVSAVGKKYYDNPRTYEFVIKLLRVYTQELNEIKELQKKGG